MKTFSRYGLFMISGMLVILINLPLLAQERAESIFEELDKERERTNTNQNQMDTDNFLKAQEKMRRTLKRNMDEQHEEWIKVTREMEVQWAEMVKRVNMQREQLRKRVEQQWKEFYYSTNREWVDYSTGMDTRSRVDFENGEIELSTLVPVDEATDGKVMKANFSELNKVQQKKVRELSEDKIKKQMKKILSPENEVQSDVLKDQIKDPEGETVTQKKLDKYIKKYIAPQIKVEDIPVVARDGKPRLKVKVKIKMVPEHLRIRAERYRKEVDKYAEKYKLDPALIYAVIHTESYFNPLAKSWVPAYGLMQLVPRYGALDAYNYLYQEKKILPANFLYSPNNNIMLGATYLHILQSNYLARIENLSNRQILSIAAYNWGPTSITKRIVKRHDVDNLSDNEVIQLINQVAPKETRDYVQRVQKRISLYRGL